MLGNTQESTRQRRRQKGGGRDVTTAPEGVKPQEFSDGDNAHEAKMTSDQALRRQEAAEDNEALGWFLSKISLAVGITMAIILGYQYAVYADTLHENTLWFSNIKEVEREISFRTEAGLYYSYYKQMVNAPSLVAGMNELMYDNTTEHMTTMNVLSRMNVFQEVLLAAVYRNVPLIQKSFLPILFYVKSVFILHGVLVMALFSITWQLSRSWIAGALSVAFYVLNKADTTRVSYTVPLRESFSLPFLWLQLAMVTWYFSPSISKAKQRFCLLGLFVSTLFFAVTWQFNQFILQLQAATLFVTQLFELVPRSKIRGMYVIQLAAMLSVCLLQFGNPMIVTGIHLSFVSSALTILFVQERRGTTFRGSVCLRLKSVLLIVLWLFVQTILTNVCLKVVIKHEADTHIYRFLMVKLGLDTFRDFDTNLYLCHGAFNFLELDTFSRLSQNLLFPIYLAVHLIALVTLAYDVIRKCRTASSDEGVYQQRPELAYHAIQTVLFAGLGLIMERMKMMWTPYMCILASVGVADETVWVWLLQRLKLGTNAAMRLSRHFIAIVVLGLLLYVALPPALKELGELREFYDPDTVELMNWINEKTPRTAAFSGSMQLLAGVKLCTGRPITNHPHYENKSLRDRTRELYQMYARREPEDVSAILHRYQASYIILEDSICLAAHIHCRLPELMDLDNGVVPETATAVDHQGLVHSTVPRFCDEVRHQSPEYSKYFKLAFHNRTFRVYRVLPLAHQ